ncbi:unnamed protein product [Tuber aestivum]|uniref:Uncharacterized protein n=1 Tax=Tuber aestivum TaxID=59557 RepID=A0A292Q8H8_9PEZI|nr:unnamed protein product [Tuber aestivum]
MARRKAVAAVEKDEEVRVTRTTRSRAAQAAQQALPSIPPPPPPPPAPRGRAATKPASRKRKPSVSSDEGDEFAAKKANIRTSPSPPPTVNRGRKAAIKNARGRRKVITSPEVSGSNPLGDEEMGVQEPEDVGLPPVVKHESGLNLPMGEGRENVEIEAEVKKPKRARKAPAKKRGVQKKKVAVPDSGIRKGRNPGRKFDGPQVEVEPEMSATDDADDGEASALASSMITEDKTDTPPSSFLVREDSDIPTEDVKVPVEEPEKVKRAPARRRGAKKVEIPPGSCRRGRSAGLGINKPQMEVASEPAEPKVEASEETAATNVEKPKPKRGRKPGQKTTRKYEKKPPAAGVEAEEETSIEGPNIEGGVLEGSLEGVGAGGAIAGNDIISGACVQGGEDGENRISGAPADQVSVEETITKANTDIEVTKAGEARVEEPKADAAVAEEAVLEETALNVAVLDGSAAGELTVESATFDKAPEIEVPMVGEEAKAEEVEVQEAKAAPVETKEMVTEEHVAEEAVLEHAVGDVIIDKPVEIEVARAGEAQMVEKMVEAGSVEGVGTRDLNTEKAIAEDTTLEPKALESEVCEAIEEEVAVQQPAGPGAGDTMEDLVDNTTAPTGILAESAGDETTSIAAEPVGDEAIGNIAMPEAEDSVTEAKIHGDEEGELDAGGSTNNPGKSSPSVADTVGGDIGAEIKDGRHGLSSLKRKTRGRLSEPTGEKVADFVKLGASHKRRSTGGGLPLPKRPRVTPPPMQPPSTPATISPSPRKVASPSAESTPRSTGPLTTPVKPLGPFLMPPATPEAVAGFGRSPTKGSTLMELVSPLADGDDGDDDDGVDGAVVATTESARRRGREMAQRHLQQYQGVFEKLRADFELSEGFQQAYQGVMRRAFPSAKPSPRRSRLSPSSPALLAFQGHGLDDGDDSFDRSFNRAVSPDRSSIVWAWDIEHEESGSQKAEGESDDADEDGAKEATADPLNVEEKASIAVIMDAPRDSDILEPTEVPEVVISDRPAQLELTQELGGAEMLEEVTMARDSDGEETEEDCGGEGEEGEENDDRGGGLLGESEGPGAEGEDFAGGTGYPGEETGDSEGAMGTGVGEGEAGPGQGVEGPEVPTEAESLTKSGGSVGTCKVKPSRLRIPAAKALKLSKAPRIPVPASRVATVKMRRVSVASLRDVPISKMTPHELASTTNTCTARNKLYSCDFTRRVVHKNAPRPPSPNAKVQTLKASQDRARRRAIQEETGAMLGPGDEENFDPNPSAKVRWGHPLESLVDHEERKSPSQAKGLLPRPSILSRSIAPLQAQLSTHGNLLTPPTEIAIERTKVTINKILYRGEK